MSTAPHAELASRASRATLVLGGARSGKSRVAEDMVSAESRGAGGENAVYIATALAGDDEMKARIAAHRARRGAGWETAEAPLELPAMITEHAGRGRAVLADCLTIWLSNLMHAGRDIDAETDALCAALAGVRGHGHGSVVLVSNEVGQGIVPENALARRFRDAAGVLNQRCAAACGRVVLVSAGLAQVLKDETK
ncbi:MAG: bifunctional adenosylcobinamide kinase/adenosylcobinamide-phosphate guanylyltransferase [Rhodospirillales bacterium]